MRIATIYDVHGNLPALDAVLGELARTPPDLLVVGGDVVLGPLPRECLERLVALDLPTRFVRGNTDRTVVAAFDAEGQGWPEAVTWVAGQLERDHRDTLAAFEPSVTLTLPALGTVLFCHATPHSDEAIMTAATPEEVVRAHLHGTYAALVVTGHTHMPYDRRVEPWRVVNPGSVGMPYGAPGAYWAMLDDEVALRHTAYDLTAAAGRIATTGYPDARTFADEHVLRPPSAGEAVAHFERLRG